MPWLVDSSMMHGKEMGAALKWVWREKASREVVLENGGLRLRAGESFLQQLASSGCWLLRLEFVR